MLAQWACVSNGWLLPLLQVWSFLLLLSARQCLAQQGGSLQNVSISNVDSQITYSPFRCNSSNTQSFDEECGGGWQVLDVNGVSVVSTQGPSAAAANIVPQFFLRIRASAVIITTSPLSNATMNITVSAGNASVNVAANSSLGVIGIFNLYEAETTTIAITYISDSDLIPSRLDIGSITAQVTNNQASSSILPTMTLPPSVSIPTFSATSSSSATSTASAGGSTSRKRLVADAVGLTVGLGLGLTAVAVGVYLIWRRRKRKSAEDVESRWSSQRASPSSGGTGPSRFHIRRNKDNQDTRWF
ncbi:hypothetical protein D9758_014266 [Tetrapyrgos nigripes]|uniref:Mid2 domain-containing protein n=1 Tax=Tetrapyrgos nigripes TaxID=182062 RepID=A0A8H5CAA2_9AGAR|nr:hypothetical protein D9758_014266 [Tetrapyrgos nigripes]